MFPSKVEVRGLENTMTVQVARTETSKCFTAHWPINEPCMEQLILGGSNDKMIAERFGVSPEDVRELRETYDL